MCVSWPARVIGLSAADRRPPANLSSMMGDCVMPFGKFKGAAIGELADAYLLWLCTIEIFDGRLRAAVQREVDRRRLAEEGRDQERRADFVDRLNAPRPEVADELVGAGLRSLARKYHPDMGGDSRRMVEVNNAADWIRAQVRAVERCG